LKPAQQTDSASQRIITHRGAEAKGRAMSCQGKAVSLATLRPHTAFLILSNSHTATTQKGKRSLCDNPGSPEFTLMVVDTYYVNSTEGQLPMWRSAHLLFPVVCIISMPFLGRKRDNDIPRFIHS
jgi:hypothetical protein